MNARKLLLFAMLVLIFAALPVSQVKPEAAHTLLDMLALVPDGPETSAVASGRGPSYVDYRAIETAMGVPAIADDVAYSLLSKADQAAWLRAFRRVAAGPTELLQNSMFLIGQQKAAVGFDWFAVDRALIYGEPPRVGTILAARYDPAQVAKALSARQFNQKQVQGVTVWYRFDDGSISIKSRERADPFGGTLGAAARIALLPSGYIANGRFWSTTEAVIATVRGTQPSLAANDDYRVLAQAISDSDSYKGTLLQVNFFSSQVFADTSVDNMQRFPHPPDLKSYGTLPAYRLVALVDRQEGDQQMHLVAVVYPDSETAKRASTELQKRLMHYDPTGIFAGKQVSFSEPRLYQDPKSGLNVVIIALSYPTPSVLPTGDNALPVEPAIIYHVWMNAIARREFVPLVLSLR